MLARAGMPSTGSASTAVSAWRKATMKTRASAKMCSKRPVVALTGDDGDNIITSIYAKQSGVGKIVVKVNREYYSDILESSGIDCVVTPKTLISQQLARYVRAMSNSVGSSMETLYRLADGKVEALEFKVAEGSACVGIPLKTLRLKPNIIISALVRGSNTIIPDGETVIKPGDHAVIVTRAGRLKELDSIVEGR